MIEASPEIQPLTDGDAVTYIMEVMQKCSMMGANDYELPELQRLIDKVRNNEIESKKAMKQAQEILDSKMDYH